MRYAPLHTCPVLQLSHLQLAVASQIIKQDGFGSMYKGLSAGLLRQVRFVCQQALWLCVLCSGPWICTLTGSLPYK